MIYNIKNNLPPNWGIQIFYTGKGQSIKALDVNPGLKRMIHRKEVILTVIPEDIWTNDKRHYELWLERWTWENMKADKILLFGGNSALCSNSIYSIQDFLHFDFIAPPTHNFHGVGGSGGISIRNRKSILQVIDYEFNKLLATSSASPWANGAITKEMKIKAMKSWPREDEFFVSRMIEMNKISQIQSDNKHDTDRNAHKYNFKLASKNDTINFGASSNHASLEAFSMSGTVNNILIL